MEHLTFEQVNDHPLSNLTTAHFRIKTFRNTRECIIRNLTRRTNCSRVCHHLKTAPHQSCHKNGCVLEAMHVTYKLTQTHSLLKYRCNVQLNWIHTALVQCVHTLRKLLSFKTDGIRCQRCVLQYFDPKIMSNRKFPR